MADEPIPEPCADEAPRRNPQSKMDEEEKRLIRETMARPDINFNIAICATALGLNYGRVERFANIDPWLSSMIREKNPEKLVPEETSLLDRDPPPDATTMLLPKDQASMMKTLMRQNDKAIKRGWQDIGLSPEQAATMEEAERRASLPIGKVLAASEGHMIGMLASSALMLDRIADQLMNGDKSKHGPLPNITDMAGSDKTQLEFLKVWQGGVMTHVNIQNTLLKTRAATIDAMKKLKELAEEKAKPTKGVFEVPAAPK